MLDSVRGQADKGAVAGWSGREKQQMNMTPRRAVAALAALYVIGCAVPPEHEPAAPFPGPECPDGREWSEWCGCLPPVYDDDC